MGGNLTAPLIDRPLVKAATAPIVSPGVDVAGCANLCFYIVGAAGASGSVLIEESHDAAFAGAWAPVGSATAVVANGVAAPVRLNATAKAVRANVTAAAVGVTVHLVGR